MSKKPKPIPTTTPPVITQETLVNAGNKPSAKVSTRYPITEEEKAGFRTYAAAALSGMIARMGLPSPAEKLLAFDIAQDMLLLEQKLTLHDSLPEKPSREPLG